MLELATVIASNGVVAGLLIYSIRRSVAQEKALNKHIIKFTEKITERPDFDQMDFAALVQNPDLDGAISDYSDFITRAHENGLTVACAADIMSLVRIKSPGEMGADVVVGSSQRFGVPLGYGGPHAAYFATRDEHKRQIPGRIIGVSLDRYGKPAYRMARRRARRLQRGPP